MGSQLSTLFSRMVVPDNLRTMLSATFKGMSLTQTAGVVFLASGTVVVLVQKLFSDQNLPPGPWGFPIVGHIPLLGKKPYITLMNMRKKYGDIIRMQFGSWPTVVLNGNAIKEALCNNGDAFSGRPQYFSFTSVQNGKSMNFGKFDSTWKLHRRIANNAFIAFASSRKNPIEEIVAEEINQMLSEFEKYKGLEFDPHDHVYVSIASVIYQICYGQKESVRDHKDFCEYILHSQKFSSFARVGNLIDMYPWLKFFLKKQVHGFLDFLKKGHIIRWKRIKEHQDTFDHNNLRDITDSLINSSKKLTEGDKANGMTEDRLLNTIGDIFAAGFDTVATTTMWMILLLAQHPHVQKKIQDELDAVVGSSRRPSLSDRSQLIYLEATLHEIMRYDCLLPLTLPHSTTTDVSLGGYTIRKDTLVLVNLYSLSHDPDVWGDPESFRPERFLTKNGEIDAQLVDKVLPFSTGRRRCIGEPLARTELFLILSGFLQRVSFVKPKSVANYSMDCHFGLNQKPLPYKVLVQKRI